MDVTDTTAEAELLLKQALPDDSETPPSVDNNALITSAAAPDLLMNNADSTSSPSHHLKEDGDKKIDEADRVVVASWDVEESCLVPKQTEENAQEGVSALSEGGTGGELGESASLELTGSGGIALEQNQMSAAGYPVITSDNPGEAGMTAPEVMATMGVEFAPLVPASQVGLMQEPLTPPPAIEEGAVVTPLEGGEAVKSSNGEEGVVTEPKKEDVKKGKEKVAKKSKKGRDSEYMGRTLSQALAGLNTPEEKIAALCKKYAELLGEHKGLQREHKTQQKQLVLLQRDRDHLQSEHGRAILAKSKLESLCRELQRHNKTIKEESIQRSKEEDEKRKEVSNKFQQTINEITNQMQDNHTRNIRLKEENLELASKLKKLVEQYERREEHIEKIFKHKELETQLSDAKLQQATLALQEEQERHKREKAILLNEAAEAQTKCDLLQKQETQLKAQLAVYTEKFEEFQTTLTKSNEIFQTFKQEMDQMTKKIKKLEKETNMWRVRWENSNKSLLNMAEERTLREKELASLKNKLLRLENLCRALQAERNDLIGKARSKEGVVSSPSKAKKQVIETVCTPPQTDTPPLTDGTGGDDVGTGERHPEPTPDSVDPVSSKERSDTEAAVDSKVLVNGDCGHDEESSAGVVNGDLGQHEESGGEALVASVGKGDEVRTEEESQGGSIGSDTGVHTGQATNGVDTGGTAPSSNADGEVEKSDFPANNPGDGGGVIDSGGEVEDPGAPEDEKTGAVEKVEGEDICSENIFGDSGDTAAPTLAAEGSGNSGGNPELDP